MVWPGANGPIQLGALIEQMLPDDILDAHCHTEPMLKFLQVNLISQLLAMPTELVLVTEIWPLPLPL